jgi:deoxyribodipyrimidine photo-lyase
VQPLRSVQAPDRDVPSLLLITEEDCSLEDFDPALLDLVGTVSLRASHLRSDLPVSDMVADFEAGALRDTANRLGLSAESWEARDPADLIRHAVKLGARQIATAYVPEGPLRDWLDAAAPMRRSAGIALTEWHRDWDRSIWPHATAGFFRVKKQIPRLIEDLALTS